jgi:hypothetical protein
MSALQKFSSTIKRTFRFYVNIGINAIKSYILNLLKINEIHNDLGASPTSIRRMRTKIIKRALTPEAAEKLQNEITWIQKFTTKESKDYLPTILDYSFEPGNTYYVMHYYNMPNFRKVILNSMSTHYFLEKRVNFLLKLQLEVFHKANPSQQPRENYFYKVFEKKFFQRIEKGCEIEPRITPLVINDFVTVNGKQMIGAKRLFTALSENSEIRNSLLPNMLCISHGDLHTNNILCGIPVNSVKLLDCRGRNSDGSFYFDPAYDIAKLYHDFHGLYSLIENHEFSVSMLKTGDVRYEFRRPKTIITFLKLYHHTRNEVIKSYTDYGKVNYRADFFEAHLFLTMIVFHLKHYEEGLMCLVRGVELLNSWTEIHYPELYASLLEKGNEDKKEQ